MNLPLKEFKITRGDGEAVSISERLILLRLVRRGPVWASIILLLVAGCGPTARPAVDATAEMSTDPDPPRVGESVIVVTLTDASGEPLTAGALHVEGNMNHAGMKPVFTTVKPTKPGQYEGRLRFTMAGDWFLLITGTLDDGRPIAEKIDIPGVQRK